MSPKHKLLTGNGAIRLTEGPIARQLIAFAVPLFLGSLIQMLAAGLLLGRTLFGLFSSDDEVIRLGLTIIRVTFPLYFVYVFLETFGGAIRGAGKALPTMLQHVYRAHRRAEAHHGEIAGGGQCGLGLPDHLDLYVVVPVYLLQNRPWVPERSEASWGDTRLGA